MKFTVKAATSKKYRGRSELIIGIVGLLSCFGLVMLIYEFVTGNVLFGISYTIATFLGFTYVIIRMNTVFATYLAMDRERLYMKSWENDFLPYNTDCRVKLVCEFIPAKTKFTEVPIDEIALIIIGTKNFIKRNVSNGSPFLERVKEFENTRDYYRKKTVSAMDMFYVETYDGSCCHMPIDRFEASNVIKIVKGIMKNNANAVVKAGSRDYRSLRLK